MTSEVGICNQALGWVGASLITSLDTTSGEDVINEVALCAANYAPLRDAVLEDAMWSFALRRRIITPITLPPVYGYSAQFLIPGDCLRVLEVTKDPSPNYQDVDWSAEGEYILADAEQLHIRYISRVIDPNQFSANFIQALATRLAAEIAVPLAQNRQLQADLTTMYEQKRDRAANLDGLQGINRPITAGKLSAARRSTRGGGYI